MTDKLTHALDAVRRGLRVFPCTPGEKRPLAGLARIQGRHRRPRPDSSAWLGNRIPTPTLASTRATRWSSWMST